MFMKKYKLQMFMKKYKLQMLWIIVIYFKYSCSFN